VNALERLSELLQQLYVIYRRQELPSYQLKARHKPFFDKLAATLQSRGIEAEKYMLFAMGLPEPFVEKVTSPKMVSLYQSQTTELVVPSPASQVEAMEDELRFSKASPEAILSIHGHESALTKLVFCRKYGLDSQAYLDRASLEWLTLPSEHKEALLQLDPELKEVLT